MINRLLGTLSLMAIFTLSPHAGWANGHEPSVDNVAKVDVLQGWRTETGSHMAAIRIQLAPGWKTYWRAPGDAGIPPRFSWEGSRNLDTVQLHWPTPKVFHQNGLRSVGYKDSVIIPIELTPKSSGAKAIKLQAEMELGVCEQICVPISVRLDADLRADGAADPLIKASLEDQPISAKSAGVRSVSCAINAISDGLHLEARIELPKTGKAEVAVVELADQTVWVSEATTTRKGRNLIVVSEMVPPNAAPFLLNRSDIRITVLGDRHAVDIRGCPAS